MHSIKVGDLVFNKRFPTKILGIVIRLYIIFKNGIHKKPVDMAVIATKDGNHHWKQRKLGVFDEDR
jgi:hypothetical protein